VEGGAGVVAVAGVVPEPEVVEVPVPSPPPPLGVVLVPVWAFGVLGAVTGLPVTANAPK
jgi:hypothetical protein